MTNTIPPTPTPPNDDERRDELLAVLVALGVLGAVSFFSLVGGPNRRGLAEFAGLSPSAAERLADGSLGQGDETDGDPTISQTFGDTLQSGADRLGGVSTALAGGDSDGADGTNRRPRWWTFPALFGGASSTIALDGADAADANGQADGTEADATDDVTGGLPDDGTDENQTAGAPDADADPSADTASGPDADADADADAIADDPTADPDAAVEDAEGGEDVPELAIETPADQFPDVPDDYWALPFIEGLRQQGIATGFTGGGFEPDSPISRAQFANQLARAFPADAVGTIDYSDVSAAHPQYEAILQVTQADFMNGYNTGDFRPNNNVSRMEVLLSLVSGLSPETPGDAEGLVKAVYEDADQIPEWAIAAIAAATDAKMAVSRDSAAKTFDPNLPATRAEAAAMLYQALVYQGKAPAIDSVHISAP